MTPGPTRLSLRAKLILAALMVETVMLTLLVVNSARLSERKLTEQARLRVESAIPLLNAALLTPLSQNDYGSASDILEEAFGSQAFKYFVLEDGARLPLLAHGKVDMARPPRLDPALDQVDDGVLDLEMAIGPDRLPYGYLRYGIDVGFLAQARLELARQGFLIAVAGTLLTGLALALIGYWLTRRLMQLTQASQSLAEGRFGAPLPEAGTDEVGRLAAAFRQMSAQLSARMAEIHENERRLHAIAQYTFDLELWIDPTGKTIWVNPSVQRMTGYRPDECLAMPGFPFTLILAEDRPEAERRLKEALRGEGGAGYQFRMMRRDGSYFWAAVNWQPLLASDGVAQGIRASIRDISDLKAVENHLLESLHRLKSSEAAALQYLHDAETERARLMALLSAMRLGILFVGEQGQVIYHNPAFSTLWVIPADESLVGLPVMEALRKGSGALARPDHFSRHIAVAIESRDTPEIFEIPLRDGRLITQVSHPVYDQDGAFIGHLWIYEDITQERRVAQQLLNLAERDSLTGLYNRHRFGEEIARAVNDAGRMNTLCGLLFFDLDDFKTINDHFGHGAGDALLSRVASEVSRVVRRNESLFRLGGDEFAVIIPYADGAHAETLAERIVSTISRITLPYEGKSLRISSSLGVAYFPSHAQDIEQLVACADAAMYQAKQAGKNAWRVYRADLDTTPEMITRMTWNERLSEAIARDSFELHFQGVHDCADRKISHLEALVRLHGEGDGELIMPALFIPIAEKGPKIIDIDRWVLRKVIGLLARHPQMPPVAVNLSGRSFDAPGMPDFIAGLLREFQVDAGRLLIEITETAAVSDLNEAQRFIQSIRQTGCRICLDDFGTGFASFAYLKHLGVDAIKIDGSFIINLTHDLDNQVFVRGMVEVARGLGKETIAECVEDEATLALLCEMGVDKVQGFLLDEPRVDHPALG